MMRTKACLLLLWCLQIPAMAHNVAFEDEIQECTASSLGCLGVDLEPNNSKDSSFENPIEQLMIPGDVCHNFFSIINSQAIFGFLNSQDDVDVYNYYVTIDDYFEAQALGPPFSFPNQPIVFVSAAAFPQACENTKDVYFSLALVADPFSLCTQEEGPLSPTDYSTLPDTLASKLPPGKTVLVVTDSGNRTVFAPDEEEIGDLAWYLPGGCNTVTRPGGGMEIRCTDDAAFITIYACNTEWLTPGQEVDPIKIQFVVFGDGPNDYTLNIGLSEDCHLADETQMELFDNNRHMVNGCDDQNDAYYLNTWYGGIVMVAAAASIAMLV